MTNGVAPRDKLMRPSHSEKTFSATRIFTDREEARTLFISACERGVAADEYKVIMWYGVGGQGKSALVREFERVLLERIKDLKRMKGTGASGSSPRRYAIAKVDFDDLRMRAVHEALLSPRLQLSKSGKIPFPAFDTAFARCSALSNPGTNIRQRHPELFSRGESEFLGDLLGWSETGIDLVTSTATISVPGIHLLYKYGARLSGRAKEWWERRGRSVLRGLDELHSDELLEKLPTYLGADLCYAIKSTRS